ncbi:MAG TPA: hypothetical protein DD670_00795 [Planctomycetaceae bacterium]|nr:hypothetical protein [Planctomycetaceae bacterium]
MTRPFFILILLLLAHADVGAAAPLPSRSVEEALFDDVKPERLPLMDPQWIKAQDPAGERQGEADRRADGARELGEAALPEETLPLLSVAERMRDVEGMLRRADCGPATQLAQRQIVQSLEQLLDQAAQQRSDGSTVPGGKVEGPPTAPTDKPGEPSSERKAEDGKESKTPGSGAKERPEGEQAEGEAKQVDTERARAMMKELWGELPPRQREQILQLPVEEFLPGYERLIEAYFRRLSEGKRQPATGAD